MPCAFSCCRDVYRLPKHDAKGESMQQDLIPAMLLIARTIQHVPSMRLLKALGDSGGTATMIHKQALPKGCTLQVLVEPLKSNTIMGTFQSKWRVYLKDLLLPEFDKNKRIEGQTALVFDEPHRYDIILRQDFLLSTRMKMNFSLKKVD